MKKVTSYQSVTSFQGFTLIEMLVVISLLSVTGVLLLTIFTRTLRGSNKSQIIATIKQNGQSILESMDKTIRNSDNEVCVRNPPTTLVVVKNGIYTRYRFIPPSISVNGSIQQDSPAKNERESNSVFIDGICDAAALMSQAVILTDTNVQTGVSVINGIFTRDRSAGYKDQVTIKFDLRPGVGAPQSIAGQIDPVSFQTTIQLR